MNATLTPEIKSNRIVSIDLLRGVIMVIMALDHVRNYFHADAFYYSPTNLDKTSGILFFTRWVTHFCAPVFVLLAGMSAHLYGLKKGKKALSFYLLTRGAFLLFVELFVIGFFRSFNLAFTYYNLQVIWAIGFSMMVLSALVYLNLRQLLVIGLILIFGHNLLDTVHFPGEGTGSFVWSLLHDPASFTFGNIHVQLLYPVLPWIGVMAVGYCLGNLYTPAYHAIERKKWLSRLGFGALILFVLLRSGNFYGDAAHWFEQKNVLFSLLSFINVTKYPPSLLYLLVLIGPALLFLAYSEKPLSALKEKVLVIGRVPMFYYLTHILLIHILSAFYGLDTGYPEMVVLNKLVNDEKSLQGYGTGLFTVYLIWMGVVVFLYPFCRWYDRYKRANQATKKWLSYV